jgi:hypothetical protein
MNKEDKIKELEEELEKTKQELNQTKEHLKRYTAPSRNKTYYENHKDKVIAKVKEYKEKTNYSYEVTPEKKKEYNKIAYLKKKEKEKSINENI